MHSGNAIIEPISRSFCGTRPSAPEVTRNRRSRSSSYEVVIEQRGCMDRSFQLVLFVMMQQSYQRRNVSFGELGEPQESRAFRASNSNIRLSIVAWSESAITTMAFHKTGGCCSPGQRQQLPCRLSPLMLSGSVLHTWQHRRTKMWHKWHRSQYIIPSVSPL